MPSYSSSTNYSDHFSTSMRDSTSSTVSSCDWNRVKHDVINGIEYFEGKTRELREKNMQLARELERVSQINSHLQNQLSMTSNKVEQLLVDKSELKIQLDKREKEQDRLKEQSMIQWQANVRLEEQYLQHKRNSDSEIHKMKEVLSQKDQELERISQEVAEAKRREAARQNAKEAPMLGTQYRSNVDEQLELRHKISHLQEEMRKLEVDNEREKTGSRRHKDELEAAKVKMKEQFSELESQQKRFLTLKKNFKDLKDENDKLRLQLRNGRRGMNPNNTWPKHVDALPYASATRPSNHSESETVTCLDIPATKFAKQTMTSSTLPSAAPNGAGAKKSGGKSSLKDHKRTNSDARSCENLPPVVTSVTANKS